MSLPRQKVQAPLWFEHRTEQMPAARCPPALVLLHSAFQSEGTVQARGVDWIEVSVSCHEALEEEKPNQLPTTMAPEKVSIKRNRREMNSQAERKVQ